MKLRGFFAFLILALLCGITSGCGATRMGGSSVRFLNMSEYDVKWHTVASSPGCFRSADSEGEGWWKPGGGGTLYFATMGGPSYYGYWGYGYGGAAVSVTLQAYDSYGHLAGAHGETYQIGGYYTFAKVFIIRNSTFSNGTGWDP